MKKKQSDTVSYLTKITANFALPDTDISGKIEFLSVLSKFIKWIRGGYENFRGVTLSDERSMRKICSVLDGAPNVEVISVDAKSAVHSDDAWEAYRKAVEKVSKGDGYAVLCIRGTSFLFSPMVGDDFKSNSRAMSLKTNVLLGKGNFNGVPYDVSSKLFVIAEKDWENEEVVPDGRFFLARLKATG